VAAKLNGLPSLHRRFSLLAAGFGCCKEIVPTSLDEKIALSPLIEKK